MKKYALHLVKCKLCINFDLTKENKHIAAKVHSDRTKELRKLIPGMRFCLKNNKPKIYNYG